MQQREPSRAGDGPGQGAPAPDAVLEAGSIRAEVFATAEAAGRAAAAATAAALRAALGAQGAVRMIFASAPSQGAMIAALRAEPGLDWSRVTAFHMDEFIGLPADAPQRFARWLSDELFDRVPRAAAHLIVPEPDPARAAARYAALLDEAPIDIVCLGIGVNGHLAFNDPPVADFDDPADVKIVDLDEICRRQQFDDGLFATLDAVPRRAVSLTIPRLLRADRLICTVSGPHKRAAVRAALEGPVTTHCPASILRGHAGCTMFLDRAAARDD